METRLPCTDGDPSSLLLQPTVLLQPGPPGWNFHRQLFFHLPDHISQRLTAQGTIYTQPQLSGPQGRPSLRLSVQLWLRSALWKLPCNGWRTSSGSYGRAEDIPRGSILLESLCCFLPPPQGFRVMWTRTTKGG